MQSFVISWNAVSQTWAEQMLAVVWQSTVLTAAVTLAAAVFLRTSSPAVRHWVWQILAIKLLVMPFWSWAIPWHGPFSSQPDVVALRPAPADNRGHQKDEKKHSAATAEEEPTDFQPDLPAATPEGSPPHEDASPITTAENTAALAPWRQVTWQSWLLLMWGAVVMAQAFRLVVQRRRLSRLLKSSSPADAGLTELVAAASDKLGLRRVPGTLIARSDFSPFVCGIREPKLILPGGLSEKLTPAELNQVLLHELAHIRRRDLVWNWIGEIARIVYFFHPVAHWINYQARLERELACDQLAMAVSGHGAKEYAATLVQVVSFASEPSVFKTAGSAGFSGECA